MKSTTKIIITFLFVAPILMLVAYLPGSSIKAGFETTGVCPNAPFTEKPSTIASFGAFAGTNKATAESSAAAILRSYDSLYCANPSAVGTIEINRVRADGDVIEYEYCKKYDDQVVAAYTDGQYLDFCCPESNPVGFEGPNAVATGDVCCPAGTIAIERNGVFSDNICKQADGSFRDAANEINTATADFIFKKNTIAYYCPQTHCLASQNAPDTNAYAIVAPNPYDSPDKASDMIPADYECFNPGQVVPGSPDPTKNICYENSLYTRSDFAVIGPRINCETLNDDVEQARCEACIEKNQTSPGRFVYSAIGCVDTSQDGFIVRMFQIGLGMIPIIGIGRIMYASILIQSQDPAKIQEGRDMVTSVGVALVVLTLAIPILQFIGINVLGIFTTGFLG